MRKLPFTDRFEPLRSLEGEATFGHEDVSLFPFPVGLSLTGAAADR
jgi:hypothetical protein